MVLVVVAPGAAASGRRGDRALRPDVRVLSNDQVLAQFNQNALQLLPSDLDRALDHDAGVCVPADRHAADDVGEPAARRSGGAAGARLSAAADRGEPAVGIGAAGRRRRRCGAAGRRAAGDRARSHPARRCRACPRGCISSSSSRARVRAARGAAVRRPARWPRSIPIWLATRLPIAATLRREILS